MIVPGALIAAGPGRSPPASNAPLPVGGMHVIAPIDVVNEPTPAGASVPPTSVIVWAASRPNAPELRWAGQKDPLGDVIVAVPPPTTRFT